MLKPLSMQPHEPASYHAHACMLHVGCGLPHKPAKSWRCMRTGTSGCKWGGARVPTTRPHKPLAFCGLMRLPATHRVLLRVHAAARMHAVCMLQCIRLTA